MFGGDPEEDFRRSIGLSPTLFPVLEGVDADPEQGGELGL